MSSTQASSEQVTQVPAPSRVDQKLEVVVIPVSDVDRAKRFYGDFGWRLDADFAFDNGFRVVQFTPPGSGCSIQFGSNITTALPGSARGLYLVVSEIETARRALAARGVEISEVFHSVTPGSQFQPDGTGGRVQGPASDRTSYGSFATFDDPDGNGWLVQEITTRLPGRGLGSLDVATLTELLREAEEGHTLYSRTDPPKHHWSGWYAAYIVARQRGNTQEEAAKEGARHIDAILR